MIKFILFAFQLLVVGVHCGTGDDSGYLYGTTNAPVLEFTKTENHFLKETTKPRVVEFYSPTCNHCITFKPEYVQLAKETQTKYKDVAFYAVSCDHHHKICGKIGVKGYPTLFVFQAGSQEAEVVEAGKFSPYTPELFAKKLNLVEKSSSSLSVAVDRRRMDEAEVDSEEETVEHEEENENEENESEDKENEEDKEDEEEDKENEEEDKENESEDKEDGENSDEKNEAMESDENGFDADNEDEEEPEDKDQTPKSRPSLEEPEDEEEDEDEREDEEGSEDEDQSPKLEPPVRANPWKPSAPGAATSGMQMRGNGEKPDNAWSGTTSGNQMRGFPAQGRDPRLGGQAVQRDDNSMRMKWDENLDPGRGQGPMRHPGAGHMKARNQYNEMNRFQEQLKDRRTQYNNKRQGLGKLMHKDHTKDRSGKPFQRTNPEAMTSAMKVNTPGTNEYNERRKKMMERIEKAQKKGARRRPETSESKAGIQPLRKESLPFRKDVRKPNFMKRQAERLPVMKRFARMTTEEELILDVSMSLVVGLESGVFMTEGKALDSEQRKALKDFLDLLSIALPTEWGIHKLIDDLRGRIGFISRDFKNLKFVLEQHPLPRKTWSKSCKAKNSIGFACGFWKLMHVATVGIAEQKGGLNLVESAMVGPETKIFSTVEAADALRNYIEHFFTCSVCKKNFVEHYDDCDNHRRCDRLTDELEEASTADWKELAVWMWEVHNEVSVRLITEKAERMAKVTFMGGKAARGVSKFEEVTAIWPNMENCFMCFEDDGTWDEDEVFKFLERSYWPDSDLDPKADRLLTFEGESGSMFEFVWLWIAVLVVIGLVYQAIGSNSAAIQRSVLVARQMVAKGSSGGKKERSY